MKYLYVLLILFLLSCTPQSESIDLEAETATLHAASERYYEFMNDNNWQGLEEIYSASGKIIPSNKDIITGEEGIKNFVDAFKSRVNFKVSYKNHEISMGAGADLGYSVAIVSTTFQDSLGNEFGGVNRDLHIWKKENGVWKVLIDIWNIPATDVSDSNTADND